MKFNLTWDLFILVFFLIIGAYSFVIGKNQTMKIILSSYLAILTADGIGNLAQRYLFGETTLLNKIFEQGEIAALVFLKISIFVILTVFLTTKGAFVVKFQSIKNGFLNFLILSLYGVMSAGLVVSTILVYLSGVSILDAATLGVVPLGSLAEQSDMVKFMVQNYSFWFFFPLF
jgi:hypothetical protein